MENGHAQLVQGDEFERIQPRIEAELEERRARIEPQAAAGTNLGPQGTLCDLPLEVFSDRGIESLVLDVDCTLLPRHSQVLPERVVRGFTTPVSSSACICSATIPVGAASEAVANSFELPTPRAGKPRRGPSGKC